MSNCQIYPRCEMFKIKRIINIKLNVHDMDLVVGDVNYLGPSIDTISKLYLHLIAYVLEFLV